MNGQIVKLSQAPYLYENGETRLGLFKKQGAISGNIEYEQQDIEEEKE